MGLLSLDENAMRELTRQCLHHDVAPIFLNHCLDGSPPRVAVVLKPLYDDCVEQLQCLSFGEVRLVVDAIPAGLRFMVEPVDELLRVEYLRRVAHYCIAAELQKAYSPISEALDPRPHSSEILDACPELRDQFDRDGLLRISASMELFDAGIKYGDRFFHYHQLLRRGFSASPNFDFLGTFARFRHNTRKENSFRIAVDHRRIMKFDDWRQTIECDTWYGPQFDPDKLDDLNHKGLTVVGREYPTSLDQYPLIKTEFFWKANEADNVKTLEIEELSCPTKPYDNWQINRYAHAERDVIQKVFRHFDGAAKVYRPSEYQSRLRNTMPNNSRPEHYIKLFRIDGAIKLPDWISLLSMFYKGNEMVIEHFDPALFAREIKPRRRQMGAAIVKST